MKKMSDFGTDYLENAINEIEDYVIILLDLDGNILNWNKGAEKIKGYKAEEIIGTNFTIFYSMADRHSHKPLQLLEVARKNGRAYDEGWRLRKDGESFWAGVTITSIHNKENEIIGYSKVTRDLTSRKREEAALKRLNEVLQSQNKEMEQFVYIASHDLKEPLRTISSLTGLLGKKYSGHVDAEGDQLIKYIVEASLRMQNLIKDLLDFSAIGINTQISTIDCNLLLEGVKRDMHATNATITVHQLPVIKGYEIELRLLFQNLISNGIKFQKKGKSPIIDISAEREGNYWKFAIKDNGIGIEPEYQDKIFMLFKRLHSRDEYEGTGIGLAHCKKIVEIHKGNIWVESKPGIGTTFYFTIAYN